MREKRKGELAEESERNCVIDRCEEGACEKRESGVTHHCSQVLEFPYAHN